MASGAPQPQSSQPDTQEWWKQEAGDLAGQIDLLRQLARQRENEAAEWINKVHEEHRGGAINLVHYLALREDDRRPLQDRLSRMGLSSLGRAEAHVMPSLDAVHHLLQVFHGSPVQAPNPAAYNLATQRLEHHTKALLGLRPEHRPTRIMVTLPPEVVDQADLLRSYFDAGMNCARINCAHDNAGKWQQMIDRLREAQRGTGRNCRIMMDLAGPKLRTGRTGEGDPEAHDSPTFTVKEGETIELMAEDIIGYPASDGNPARISCTLPLVFKNTECGERVLFHDGRIETVIREVHQDRLVLEVRRTPPREGILRANQGINFPDSTLNFSGLTPQDLLDLDVIARHADAVALSFVNTDHDVNLLIAELRRQQAERLGLVIKVETRHAFESLPRILMAAMQHPSCGVMIARGDLAVEVGMERLAEVQEEILWLCEAARIPVIWATQVLENLSRKGMASRAEVTDAAMAERAECAMLNRGMMATQAIASLDEILTRMASHMSKKSPRLRRLSISSLEPR